MFQCPQLASTKIRFQFNTMKLSLSIHRIKLLNLNKRAQTFHYLKYLTSLFCSVSSPTDYHQLVDSLTYILFTHYNKMVSWSFYQIKIVNVTINSCTGFKAMIQFVAVNLEFSLVIRWFGRKEFLVKLICFVLFAY